MQWFRVAGPFSIRAGSSILTGWDRVASKALICVLTSSSPVFNPSISSSLINLARLAVSIMFTRPNTASTACCGVIFSCFAIILMFSVLILSSFSENPSYPAPDSCLDCLQTYRLRYLELWIQIWVPAPV